MLHLGGGDFIEESMLNDGSSKEQLIKCVNRLAFSCQRCGIALFVEDEITCANVCEQEYYCQTCGKKENTWRCIGENTGAMSCGPACAPDGAEITDEMVKAHTKFLKAREQQWKLDWLRVTEHSYY